MAKYTEKQQNEVVALCKFLKKILPKDEGVDYLCSADYMQKTLLAVTQYKFLVFSGLYGHKALLGWLEYLIKIEDYEHCQQIIDYIEEINKKKTKNKFPTSLNIESHLV